MDLGFHRRGDWIATAIPEVYVDTYITHDSRTEPSYEHREGGVARSIEQQTARMPSDWFLWAALGSIGASLTLQLMDRKEYANFVGQWAPTLLILGLYNKMVKLHGSDGK